MDEPFFLCLVLSHLRGVNLKDRITLLETAGTGLTGSGLTVVDIQNRLGKLFKTAPDVDAAKKAAEKTAKIAEMKGITMIPYLSSAYPPLLREWYDAPALLYARGRLSDPEKPLVAMVGTRRPSGAASDWAYRCGRDFGECGFAVVSGLALGIDALCHRGNMDGGGRTIAVLGSAVDELYPASNRPVARRILDTGGLIVSEYPPGTRPAQWRFPERNRIIAGLARGCIIVEAPEKSGALITARLALENSRDIWVSAAGAAISEDPRRVKTGKGTRNLVEQGAKVINGASDVLEEWGLAAAVKTETVRDDEPFSPAQFARALQTELGL